MAEQILTPSDLYGAGTSNTIILGGTVTAVLSTNQYSYFFSGGDGQTNWDSVITAASSPNVDTSNPLWAAQLSGRGTNAYINTRVMSEFNLSGISGTILSITAYLTTMGASEVINVNLYDAGTTGLTGIGGEYSYYRDEGEVKFSDTAQDLSSFSTFGFTLNSAALTVANTKPSSFVIAAVNSFDFNSSSPTPLYTTYQVTVSTITLNVTHS
jgi:hypothetical protein